MMKRVMFRLAVTVMAVAALITKGDGFIWIKSKTNYDPVLNRHLNQSYFYGGKNEILF
jgi:hypothetical protein